MVAGRSGIHETPIYLLWTDKKLDINKIAMVNIEFEQSTIPFEIDIIDLKSVSEEFKNIIKDKLIKL